LCEKNVYKKDIPNHEINTIYALSLNKEEYNKIKLFILSILLKAHYSPDYYKNICLGKYAEIIENTFLKKEFIGEYNAFPMIINKVSPIIEVNIDKQTILNIIRTKSINHSHKNYTMTILGYDITIMMKKDFALSNKEIYVNYNDKFFIPSFTSPSAVISK